jgi:hypothetical protein
MIEIRNVSRLKIQNAKLKMQNDNLKLKINKFKRPSLRGAERRSNPKNEL